MTRSTPGSLYGDRPNADTLRDLLSGTHMSGESKALIALLAREDMREKFAATMSDLTANAFEKNHILETLDELCAMSDSEQFYALDKGITSEWANRETFRRTAASRYADFADIREYVVFRNMYKLFGVGEKHIHRIRHGGGRGRSRR